MAGVLDVARRRRWAPGPNAKIDRTHPLSVGLLACWLPDAGWLAGPDPSNQPSSNEVVAKFGKASQHVTPPSIVSSSFTTDAVTVGLIYAKSGSNTVSGGFGLASAATAVRCGAHIPWSDGTIYWDFGAVSAPGRLTMTGHTFSPSGQVFVFTAGAEGQQIWVDGVLGASTASVPTRTTSSVRFNINGGHGAGVADPNSWTGFLVAWNRQLPQTEIMRFFVDPFAMLRTGG